MIVSSPGLLLLRLLGISSSLLPQILPLRRKVQKQQGKQQACIPSLRWTADGASSSLSVQRPPRSPFSRVWYLAELNSYCLNHNILRLNLQFAHCLTSNSLQLTFLPNLPAQPTTSVLPNTQPQALYLLNRHPRSSQILLHLFTLLTEFFLSQQQFSQIPASCLNTPLVSQQESTQKHRMLMTIFPFTVSTKPNPSSWSLEQLVALPLPSSSSASPQSCLLLRFQHLPHELIRSVVRFQKASPAAC